MMKKTRKYYNPRLPQKNGCFILSAGWGSNNVNLYDCTRLNEKEDGIYCIAANIRPEQAGHYWTGYLRDLGLK